MIEFSIKGISGFRLSWKTWIPAISLLELNMIIKKCPYCIQKLPIVNLIKQRLTIKKEESLVCPHCSSRISSSSGAHIGFIASGSSMVGFILGKLASKLSQGNELGFIIGITAALLLFLLLTYITSPIRNT